MKRFIYTALAALSFGAPAFADPVAGTWRSQPGETGGYIHVRISTCGSGICGVITDVVGNDNTSIVGRTIISNMSADGNGRYSGGRIWAPDNDKTYNSKMTLQNANQLKVEGCVAVFCRSQTWTRLN
jgi:uncharacterized protein (DUF2147 family)